VHRNEWPQTGRTLVLIPGACAAVNSTLSRVNCGEGGLERTRNSTMAPLKRE
jgi:hypothetical protein